MYTSSRIRAILNRHVSVEVNLAGVIGIALLTASGCFGGGDSSEGGTANPPPPPPLPPTTGVGGLWSGAMWWDPKDGFPGGAQNVRLLVTDTGEFRMMLYPDVDNYFAPDSEQISGTFNIVGRDITTVGDAVWVAAVTDAGDEWAWFGLAGEYVAGESISGTFQAVSTGWSGGMGEPVGTFSLNYHSLYENPSSLDILQGTYATTTDSLTINAQGAIFYQSSVTGCTGNGTAETIDPAYNMYRVTLDVESCSGDEAVRNGLTFTGLANVGQNNDPGGAFLSDTLEMAVTAPRDLHFGPDVIAQGYVPWSLLAPKQ